MRSGLAGPNTSTREHPAIPPSKPQRARGRFTRNPKPFPAQELPLDIHPFRRHASDITRDLRSLSDDTIPPPRLLRSARQPTRGNLASSGAGENPDTYPGPPFDLRGMQTFGNLGRPRPVDRRSGKKVVSVRSSPHFFKSRNCPWPRCQSPVFGREKSPFRHSLTHSSTRALFTAFFKFGILFFFFPPPLLISSCCYLQPAFIQALRQSDTLHTLVRVPGRFSTHPIDRTNVTHIMTSTRRLRRVESENQIWLVILKLLGYPRSNEKQRWKTKMDLHGFFFFFFVIVGKLFEGSQVRAQVRETARERAFRNMVHASRDVVKGVRGLGRGG